MEKMFGYPEFSMSGERVLTSTKGECANMMMDISVLDLKCGDKKTFCLENSELAILLIKGSISYSWQGKTEKAERKDCFDEGGYCLHICKNVSVTIEAQADSEVLLQSAENDKTFEPVFYTPTTCRDDIFGLGELGGNVVRTVRTYFDYDNAPYSNMVLGEVISGSGGWTSYLPHSHTQPEVYYYHFDHPNGFGACFIGEDVFKVTDGSFCAIPGDKMHPQATAPGYRMYYVWMIRHLENNPWTDRIFDPKHTWLLNK